MVDGFDFDDKWRLLRQRFIARLRERERNIRNAWEQVQSGRDGDGAARNLLFHQIHSLSGSGATFGCDELSVAARRIEPMIDPEQIPLAHPLDPKALQTVETALEDLVQELRRISAESGH